MEESEKKMYLKFEKEKKEEEKEKREKKRNESVVRILLHRCPKRIDAHTTYFQRIRETRKIYFLKLNFKRIIVLFPY